MRGIVYHLQYRKISTISTLQQQIQLYHFQRSNFELENLQYLIHLVT